MGKSELLPLAKVYFDHNKNLEVIYGTEDKHFFYEEIYAQRYKNENKVEFFTFTKEDFVVKKKKTEPKKEEPVKEEPQNEEPKAKTTSKK